MGDSQSVAEPIRSVGEMDLEPGDGAVVFKEDGVLEVAIPKLAPSGEVAISIGMVIWLFSDEPGMEEMRQELTARAVRLREN